MRSLAAGRSPLTGWRAMLRTLTAEELEKFPRDDRRYELVRGRLVLHMTPVAFPHGVVVARVCFLLSQYLQNNKLGVAVTELGCKLTSSPDTVRAPDVAFIRRERIPSNPPKGFWKGAPDLAIEVLSPDDRPTEVREKIAEYLAHGVSLVVVIDPDPRTAATFHASGRQATLEEHERLDLGDVMPGVGCVVREIFE
jgi:Uma2 family endonuclease